MPNKPHKGASDLLREANLVFTKKVTFKEAFPEIKNTTVKVEESGNLGGGLFGESSKTKYYNIETLAEFIDCSNPSCHEGGFSIGKFFREMEQEKKTHFDGQERCQGFEQGSVRFKASQLQCCNRFKITIDTEYK